MLPPLVVRRLVLIPLVLVIAAALVLLTPPLALLSAAFSLVRRRPGRKRTLRLVYFALVWSLGEAAALAVCLCLWIVSGFGGRLGTEPYQSRHYAVMHWFLDLIYGAAERACGLRVEVDGPLSPAGRSGSLAGRDGPLIVLSRHAGPGDSLLLIRHLLTVCGRRPRVVMKASLQLDPSLDVVGNRVPNVFVRRRGGAAEQVGRLAAGLGRRDALVLFPEGANWTPSRWRRAIRRLHRHGQNDLAERAMALPNVLLPRPRGAFAAMTACPAADVVFVAHTGLDRMTSVRDVWRGLSADQRVRARWWLVPASEVPRAASRDAQREWLYEWWQRVDSWITAERGGRGPGRAPLSTYSDVV